MARQEQSEGVTSRGYDIRSARPSDCDDIVRLYTDVLDPGYSRQWFEWKYANHPYAERLPIVVATDEDRVVGALGYLPFHMSTGRRTIFAVQPCDGAVDPAHRRQGLYTAIFAEVLEQASKQGAKFAFDFPNALTRATFEKFGWRCVGTQATSLRLHRPSRFFDRLDSSFLDRMWSGITAVRALDNQFIGDFPEMEIEVIDGVPTERIVGVYERDIPNRLHASRDSTFYHWRFANPLVKYRTYLSIIDDRVVCAIIVGITQRDGAKAMVFAEILPLTIRRNGERELHALLQRVIRDAHAVDVIVAPTLQIPTRGLRRLGFWDDQRLPMSIVTEDTIHGVRALGDQPSWEIDGCSLTDPDSWLISFTEFDTW